MKSAAKVGVLAFAVLGVSYTRTEIGVVPTRCLQLSPHAVRTSSEAILAMRNAWYCMQPRLERTAEADRWHIGPRLLEWCAGGGLNMEIAPEDGRVLRVVMTQ